MAADGSLRYVAFYPEALLFLTRLGDLEAISVLFALGQRANAFGYCDPGDKLIGMEAGHRRDAIPAILERLQAIDYLHVTEIPVLFRQEALRGFYINPFVIRLRAANHASAVAEWERFNSQTNGLQNGHYKKQAIGITHGESDHQPDQIKNQDQNQLHNQDHNHLQKPHQTSEEQAPKTALSDPRASGADQAHFDGVGQKQKPEPTTEPEQGVSPRGEAPSDARAVPSAAAAPPPREPKDLARFRHPLADEDDENVALDLVNTAGDMSRENARMLVDTYGAYRVGVVVQLFFQQKTVASPARWIRSMLRKTDVELWKARKNG